MIVIEPYKKEYREEIIELVLSIQQGEFNVP